MDAAMARDCSPIVHVNAHTAPTLLIHGEKDTLVPTEHSQHMMEALKNAKVVSDLLVVKGAGHGNVEHDRGVMPAIVEWFEAQFQVDHR
jgi:dipeptidyl aminopeptidase/acylaminoacyl peptidase